MKMRLHRIFVMAIVCCMLAVCALPAFAEGNDSNYYYKVTVSTELEGDDLVQESFTYYALHGVQENNVNFVMDPFPEGSRSSILQPGDRAVTDVFVFCSPEAVCAVRLLQDSDFIAGLQGDEKQYYLELSMENQQPGIENALTIDRLHIIEGFGPGGELILSDEKKEPAFTLTYDAPPMFSGADSYTTYHTTQYVTVEDKNLTSVTLNGEPVAIENGRAVVTLPGNIDKEYTIVAQDASGGENDMVVWMESFSSLMLPVSHLTPENVRSEHEEDVRMVLDNVQLSLQEPHASAAEKHALNVMKQELEQLLSRIDEAAESMNTESIWATKGITAENVASNDKQILEQAESDLESALRDYSGNYTDSEISMINADLERVREALQVICSIPVCGDDSRMGLWFMLLAAGTAGILGFASSGKNKKQTAE